MSISANTSISKHKLLSRFCISNLHSKTWKAFCEKHELKLIHRDVKPENMLLGPSNEVLLSDFGIAAVAHSTSSLKTHAYSGTVHYSAPEQIQGKLRPASDQYALGVVVYEWLTGSRPFSGDSHIEIAMHHISTPPPLHVKLPTISPAVEQVVLKALAKDPHQRFDNVLEFVTSLEQASTLPPMGTTLLNTGPTWYM